MGYEAWETFLNVTPGWAEEIAAKNFTYLKWIMMDLIIVEDGITVWIAILKDQVTRLTRCNWIQPDREPPE